MKEAVHIRGLQYLTLGILFLANYVACQGPALFPRFPRTQFGGIGGLTPLTGATRLPTLRGSPLGLPGITTLPATSTDGLTFPGALTDTTGLAGLEGTGPIALPPFLDTGDGTGFGSFPGFPSTTLFGGSGTPVLRPATTTLFGGQPGTVFGTTTDRRVVAGTNAAVGGTTSTTGGAVRLNGPQGFVGGTRTVTARGVAPTGTLRTTGLGRLGLGAAALGRTLPATLLRARTTRLPGQLTGLGSLGTGLGLGDGADILAAQRRRAALTRAATAGTDFGTGTTLLGGLGLDPSAMFVDPITGQRVRLLRNDDAASTIATRTRQRLLTLPGMARPREGARVAGLTTIGTDTNSIINNNIDNLEGTAGRRVSGLTTLPGMPATLPSTLAGAVSGDATARFVAAAAARARADTSIENLPTNWLGLTNTDTNSQNNEANGFLPSTSNRLPTGSSFFPRAGIFSMDSAANSTADNNQMFIIRQIMRNAGGNNSSRVISETVINGISNREMLFTDPVREAGFQEGNLAPQTIRFSTWLPQNEQRQMVFSGVVPQSPSIWPFGQMMSQNGQQTFQQQMMRQQQQLQQQQQQQQQLFMEQQRRATWMPNVWQPQWNQIQQWPRRWQLQESPQMMATQQQRQQQQEMQQTELPSNLHLSLSPQNGSTMLTPSVGTWQTQMQFPVRTDFLPQNTSPSSPPLEIIESNDARFRSRQQPNFFGEFQTMDNSFGTSSFMMPVIPSSFTFQTGLPSSSNDVSSRTVPTLTSFGSFSTPITSFGQQFSQIDNNMSFDRERPVGTQSDVFFDGNVFREQGNSLFLDTEQMQLLENTLQTGSFTSRSPQTSNNMVPSLTNQMNTNANSPFPSMVFIPEEIVRSLRRGVRSTDAAAQAAELAAAEAAALASRRGTGSASITSTSTQTDVSGGPLPALSLDQIDTTQFNMPPDTGSVNAALSGMSFDSSINTRTGPASVIGATGSVDATVDIMNTNRRRPIFAIVPLTPRANVADIQNFVSQLSSSISGTGNELAGQGDVGGSTVRRVSTTSIIPSSGASAEPILPTIVPADNIRNDARSGDRNLANDMVSGISSNDVNSGFFPSDITGPDVIPASPDFVNAASDFGFPVNGNPNLLDATTI